VFVVVQATGSNFDLVGAEIKAVGAIGDETVTELPSASGVELPQDEEAGDEGNEGNEGDEGNEGTCLPQLPRFPAAAKSCHCVSLQLNRLFNHLANRLEASK
jgi:hypothetical protein